MKLTATKYKAAFLSLLLPVLYVGLSPLVNKPLWDIVLFPGAYFKADPAAYDFSELARVPRRDLYITAVDGSKLHAWYFYKPGSKQVMLVHHGNGTTLPTCKGLTTNLLALGYSVLVYDYRGFGKSTGHPSPEGILEDAETAYNWLLDNTSFKGNQVIQFGASLGSGVACNIAAKKTSAAVILLAPYTSLREVAYQRFNGILRIYPEFMIGYKDIETRTFFRNHHVPTLAFHGERDATIPVSHLEEITRLATQPFQGERFATCGHLNFFSREPTKSKTALINFMQIVK